MKSLLALDAGYRGIRARAVDLDGQGGSYLAAWDFPPHEPDFALIEREIGTPSLVAIPGGTYGPPGPTAGLPSNAGVYRLDRDLAREAGIIDKDHPRNRMTVACFCYCRSVGTSCYVVEPMASAKLRPEASLSGTKGRSRRGVFYALPQKAAWDDAKRTLGLGENACGLTVYLGEECCVSSHAGNDVVDTSDPVLGEGPFGLTAAGTLPAGGLFSYLGQNPVGDPVKTFKAEAGLLAYAGADSIGDLESMLSSGDEGAVSAVVAMGYQVAKEVGRQVTAFGGDVSVLALTGPGTGIARLCREIEIRVSKWTRIHIHRRDVIDVLLMKGSAASFGEI